MPNLGYNNSSSSRITKGLTGALQYIYTAEIPLVYKIPNRLTSYFAHNTSCIKETESNAFILPHSILIGMQ